MNRFTYWLLALIVIVAGVVGVIVLVQDEEEDPVEVDENGDPIVVEYDNQISDDEWTKWNEDSEVILIEYSDFQCPACAARVDVIEDLEAEFGDYVRFVYRHFPLESIHPNAERAAMAAEAAGIQNEFWAMHDLLFENQQVWSQLSNSDLDDQFVSYAEEIGLDVRQFEDDLDSSEVEELVQEDIDFTEEFGLSSTPTFFLNNRLLSTNEASYESLRTILTEAIRDADGASE